MTDPLRPILKDKAKAVSKYEFLKHCTAIDFVPKGVLPVVPLKIADPPAQLKAKWNDTIVECGNKLMNILIDFHLEHIKSKEEIAQDTITRASQIILPEFVTDIPDIGDKIEEAIEDLLAETNRTAKKIPRKRKSENTNTTTTSKRPKNDKSSSTEEARKKKTKSLKLQKGKKRLNRRIRRRYLKRIYTNNIKHDINTCYNHKCVTCAKLYVANLSGRPLSDPQILLLSKGLSFIPTPTDSTTFELLTDFNRFYEKIRSLSKHKHTYSNNININKRFSLKRKQKWKPKQHFVSSTDLEGVLDTMKLEISRIPTADNLPYNLSPEERKALREFKCNHDLVINKADKGSTMVVYYSTIVVSYYSAIVVLYQL